MVKCTQAVQSFIKHGELVTPIHAVVDGQSLAVVQDCCPLDVVESNDLNVWNVVLNSLENQLGRKFIRSLGITA